MTRTRAGWLRWYRSWEVQQEHLNRNRERRFSAMLDVVAASLPARFVAVDLGCGPGSLSARLLTRFPRARCVAVDHDPVVQRIGRGALGTFGGRLTWADADLGTVGWDRALPQGRFDVALSTTALHWLDRTRLVRLYHDLHRRLRPGGVVLNGDRLPWGEERPALSRLAGKVRDVRLRRAGRPRRGDGWGVWRSWWSAAERDPELAPLFALRAERRCRHPRHGDLPLSVHVRALRRAGFRDVDVVWRDLEDGILLARR
ncbi:MAG TPA: class I SAM-dependent methyltransferase [Thermoplasmata archaeon]|nr:class I SAM-dependent methyltransferase [Thermoplasmata archaeon]